MHSVVEPAAAGATPTAGVPTPSAPDAASLRLLIAEDNALNQKLALKYLNLLGHTAELACDGAKAVAMWAHGTYDAVLMDVQMPLLSGLQATREIRRLEAADEQRGHIPIFAMTANALDADRQRCSEAGMDAFLPKPIDLVDLARMLDRHCPTLDGEQNAERARRIRSATQPLRREMYDARRLLERACYERQLARRMACMLLEDMPHRLDGLHAALRAGDAAGAAGAAHSLIGMLANAGASAAAEHARGLERAVLQGQAQLAGPAHVALVNATREVLDALRLL